MRKAKHPAIFWIFLAPVLFAFVMVIVVPFVLGVCYSFTNWSATARLNDALRFIGLRNYLGILKDSTFTYSFMLTVVYTALNMIAINVVSFGLAILVTRAIKARNVYRAGILPAQSHRRAGPGLRLAIHFRQRRALHRHDPRPRLMGEPEQPGPGEERLGLAGARRRRHLAVRGLHHGHLRRGDRERARRSSSRRPRSTAPRRPGGSSPSSCR